MFDLLSSPSISRLQYVLYADTKTVDRVPSCIVKCGRLFSNPVSGKIPLSDMGFSSGRAMGWQLP